MQPSIFRGWVAILAALGMGCGPARMGLRPVPEKTAPLADRQRAFQDLRPVHSSRDESGSTGRPSLTWLELGDGTRVKDPQVLLAAVDPISPTAGYVRAYGKILAKARPWLSVGAVVIGTGVGMMIYGLGATALHGLESNGAFGNLVVGAGVALLGLIPSVVGVVLANSASADKARTGAFQSYEQSLAHRLDVDGTAVDRTTDDGDGDGDGDVEERSDAPSRSN